MSSNLLEPNYQEVYTNWQREPSPAHTGALLKTVQPVINSAMRTYAGPSARSANVKSRAKLLTIDAMKSYDPARGPLKPHLMSRLQRLRRVAAQQRQIIQVPEQVALDQMRSDAAGKELEDKLGRPASDQELADFTGLSVKRLQYIRDSSRPLAESTITRMGDEGAGSYDPRVQKLTTSHNAWLELVYDDLDPTNQYIMERALGMHGHPAAKPSALAKQLKVSPAAISHRMAQIQTKIDKRDELGML